MPPLKDESVDRRIVECWRAGVRSAGDIGRRTGVDPMRVGRRIARMVEAGAWPFEPPTKGGRRADDLARRTGAVSPRPEPPAGVASAQLSLHIRADLHTRLRGYCRETGATVSETVEEALTVFLQGKRDLRHLDPRGAILDLRQ